MTLSKSLVKKISLFIFLVLVIGVGSSPALADTIELGDGNILKGTVSSLEKGTLIISTEYAEKNSVPVAKIKTISTDKAVTIKMTNDSILTGKLTTLEDGQVAVLLEPSGKTVPIEWNQVKNINEPPGSWDGNFVLGGNIKNGNTDSVNFSLAFGARREWEHDRFSFRALYNYEENDKVITARDTFGSMKFDHFFTGNIYSALSMEVLRDEFRDINLRLILGLGLGYRIWNDDVKTLELEAGIAYSSVDKDIGMDNDQMAGRIGTNISYKIFENIIFRDFLLFYPSLENLSEYALRNEAHIISELGAGWALRLSHIFETTTPVAPGVENTDTRLIFGIQYAF